jgi:SAM-dependent methyltransferase
MKGNYRQCPACQKHLSKKLGVKNGFTMLLCAGCRSIYTERLPFSNDKLDYDIYYSEENLKIPEFIYQRLERLFSDFSKYRKTNRWLDIGFGAGGILEVASKLGWEVFGVEVSKPAIEYARKKGFSNIFHGELFEADYPSSFFDVVTASEIIEHLFEPQALFMEINKILRSGGLFWATTPSAQGISCRLIGLNWSVVSPPEHVQIFSKKGISIMLKRAGFSSMKIYTEGTNPFEILSCYFSSSKERRDFDRVKTSYQLNESFEKSLVKRNLKSLLNKTLNLFALGDSLKIYAFK